MSSANQFSAAGSTLGTLVQVHYALSAALDSSLPEDTEISIETEDDFVLEPVAPEGLRELYQSKHHIHPSGIGDKDAELWKSIGNWSVGFRPQSPMTRIFLTTAKPVSGTAAFSLTSTDRNEQVAADLLLKAAKDSSNAETAPARKWYEGLGVLERSEFVSSIVISGGAPRGDEIFISIKRSLIRATARDRMDALVLRLVGWWDLLVAEHLMAVSMGRRHPIRLLDVNEKVVEIAQSLSIESLPLDYENLDTPSEAEVRENAEPYALQLHWIGMAQSRLTAAIHAHNQAYRQRSAWQADGLVRLSHLQQYDERIRREWSHYFDPLSDDEDAEKDENALKGSARNLYRELQIAILPEIVSRMPSSYVSRGTLQILANDGRIGWHPNWEERFRGAFPDLWNEFQEGVA